MSELTEALGLAEFFEDWGSPVVSDGMGRMSCVVCGEEADDSLQHLPSCEWSVKAKRLWELLEAHTSGKSQSCRPNPAFLVDNQAAPTP